jgi:hypothetical protein
MTTPLASSAGDLLGAPNSMATAYDPLVGSSQHGHRRRSNDPLQELFS